MDGIHWMQSFGEAVSRRRRRSLWLSGAFGYRRMLAKIVGQSRNGNMVVPLPTGWSNGGNSRSSATLIIAYFHAVD